jgi:DNA-directed RNA polymerase specialized sigma24 family protein
MTDWSLIDRLSGDEDAAARRLDLNELVTRYAPAMRRFLLQRFRADPHEVEDWLQGFLASRILQGALLSRVDKDRGKFRTFVSHALSDYAIDQLRRARVRNAASLDAFDHANDASFATPNQFDPAVQFSRNWAQLAIDEALRRTQERLDTTGRGVAWAVFSRRLLEPGATPPSYEALAREFAFETPIQASIALKTVKRIFRRKLQDVLAEFGTTEPDLDEAIAELKRIFQN